MTTVLVRNVRVSKVILSRGEKQLALPNGVTAIDADELKAYRANPMVEALFKAKVLLIYKPDPQGYDRPDGDPIAAIAACGNTKQLERWIHGPLGADPAMRKLIIERGVELRQQEQAGGWR